MTTLSVIIPARNDGGMTGACLDAALHSVAELGLVCEFILIDDASEPEEKILPVFLSARAIGSAHEFKIVRSNIHQHYSRVFSIGLHVSTGNRVFFLSNDMWVTPTFIESLLRVSALEPKFGIIRGTSNHTDSHPEYLVVPDVMPRNYGEIEAYSQQVFAANGLGWREDKVLSGDAVLIKRSVIDTIGVVDPRFFGFFGDIDYGMRAHLAGYKLVCAGGAWLYHSGGGYLRRESEQRGEPDVGLAFQRRMELVQQGYREFREKWGGDLPPRFADLKSMEFFPTAEARARHVPLRCELPATFLKDLEVF